MRIRRLARKAVFITAAVMVLAGFSTGISGAANAAPASPAVTSSGTIHRMPLGCTGFCTYELTTRGLILIQEFACVLGGHSGIRNPIYQMTNTCANRVYWYNPSQHCIEPHSSLAGVGRFGTVYNINIGARTNC
jgi:hypothetical protein